MTFHNGASYLFIYNIIFYITRCARGYLRLQNSAILTENRGVYFCLVKKCKINLVIDYQLYKNIPIITGVSIKCIGEPVWMYYSRIYSIRLWNTSLKNESQQFYKALYTISFFISQGVHEAIYVWKIPQYLLKTEESIVV
jgi:hypothetical protein